MKMLGMSLVVCGVIAPMSLAKVVKDAPAPAAQNSAVSVALVAAPSEAGANIEVTVSPDENGVMRQHVQLMRIAGADDPEAANKGWLGVMLEEVNELLSQHLAIGETGVMVINVAEGSPASNAGVQVNDIILSIDGQPVASDVGALAELISGRKPGEKVSLAVQRGGEKLTLNVTLGARSESANVTTWATNFDPSTQIEEKVQLRGKVVLRDEDGNWMVQDLSDHDLSNLQGLQMALPGGVGTHSAQITINDGKRSIVLTESKDGETITVNREDDGPITVTRVDENGETSVKTYNDDESLQAGDEQAAELLARSQNNHIIEVDVDGMADLRFEGEAVLRGLPDTAHMWTEKLGDHRVALRWHMDDAHKALAESMKHMHGSLKDLDLLIEGHDIGRSPHMVVRMGKAAYSFVENPDGSIDATLRKGDSEIIKKFTSASDLQTRDPELFAKFSSLTEDEPTKE